MMLFLFTLLFSKSIVREFQDLARAEKLDSMNKFMVDHLNNPKFVCTDMLFTKSSKDCIALYFTLYKHFPSLEVVAKSESLVKSPMMMLFLAFKAVDDDNKNALTLLFPLIKKKQVHFKLEASIPFSNKNWLTPILKKIKNLQRETSIAIFATENNKGHLIADLMDEWDREQTKLLMVQTLFERKLQDIPEIISELTDGKAMTFKLYMDFIRQRMQFPMQIVQTAPTTFYRPVLHNLAQLSENWKSDVFDYVFDAWKSEHPDRADLKTLSCETLSKRLHYVLFIVADSVINDPEVVQLKVIDSYIAEKGFDNEEADSIRKTWLAVISEFDCCILCSEHKHKTDIVYSTCKHGPCETCYPSYIKGIAPKGNTCPSCKVAYSTTAIDDFNRVKSLRRAKETSST